MDKKLKTPPSGGMNLGDIYYTLFRHKWKIVAIFSLGLAGALLLPLVWIVPYQSEAKLFIRYVMETKSPGQMASSDSRIKSPDESGRNIINSELEILTSLDLAEKVADAVGPEKILARAGGGSDRNKAAGLVRRSLLVDVPKQSDVIRVTFQHPDPAIVQPVLSELVEAYLKKHAEIHRAVGMFDDFLTQETDQLWSRLKQTENALREAKTNAGVISIDDTKKGYNDLISQIRQSLFDAQAQLAEHRAAADELARLLNPQSAAATNAATSAGDLPVPAETVAEYKRLISLLETLDKREQELALQFTDGNTILVGVREKIAENEKRKNQLEAANPGLLAVKVSTQGSGDADSGSRADLNAELAKVAALTSRIMVLSNQLQQVRQEAIAVDAVEGSLNELQRKRELEEAHYKYFAANLEQARIDEALGPGRVSNISKIQAPSPPFRDRSKQLKAMAGLLFGSLAAGFALAFLIEFVLDRSLRRPAQIETFLDVPLFISIPRLSQDGKPRGVKVGRARPLLTRGNAAGPAAATASAAKPSESPVVDVSSAGSKPAGIVAGNDRFAPWDVRKALRPFYETLRDRLIVFFEVRNLLHKPKLVAVTSCATGSGVTTVASGLAACLSETGDGNVLLVDMNLESAEAHHFHKGRLACGLDDALEAGDKRESAMVKDNLYVVTETTAGDGLSRVLPRRFQHLMPKLRASDYDYIIFDMPPISQVSATPRLARFMDMVFLVVESEKSDRDVVKRATTMLSESKATVGVVLNQSKSYVPRLLQQEL